MAVVRLNAKQRMKRSTVQGELPTVAPSEDHTDGSWSDSDIYEGELFMNTADRRVYTRVGSNILSFMLSGNSELSLNIGAWDMTSTASVNISHGLSQTEFKSIKSISVIIRNDNDDMYYPLEVGNASGTMAGYVGSIDATNIVLNRFNNGFFSNSAFRFDTKYKRFN